MILFATRVRVCSGPVGDREQRHPVEMLYSPTTERMAGGRYQDADRYSLLLADGGDRIEQEPVRQRQDTPRPRRSHDALTR